MFTGSKRRMINSTRGGSSSNLCLEMKESDLNEKVGTGGEEALGRRLNFGLSLMGITGETGTGRGLGAAGP